MAAPCWCVHRARFARNNQPKSAKNVALHSRESDTPQQAKSMTYATRPRSNCRRWVKRRHGLRRCRYKGFVGMNRWVGLAVIADNLVNIGRAIEKRQAS
jgi:hypothetical protein